MRTFTHDGLTVAYRDEGHGPAIVMLHNGGTSSCIWRHQIDALSDRHRVVAVDLPGFGASPRPAEPARLGDLVELVAELVRSEGLAPAVFVGNCMGTNVAATLARSAPELVTAVLAVNPLTEASFSAGRLGLLHRMERVAAAPTHLLRSLSRRVRAPRPVGVATLRFQLGDKGVARGVHRDPELLACQLRPDQVPALVDVLDDMAAYGELDVQGVPAGTPVWVVWGAQNRVLSRRRAAHLGRVLHAERVEVLEGCGHLPMLEDPGAVTSLVEDLVARTSVPAAASGPAAATEPADIPTVTAVGTDAGEASS